MKTGGVSWNRSDNHKKGIDKEFNCSACGRKYKQGWTKDNHEKLCRMRKK